MQYAIKCYFTEETATSIRHIWEDLHAEEFAKFMKDSGSRPGVTLGVWEEALIEDLEKLAVNFAKQNPSPPKVTSYGIGTFPTDPAHVFLGLVPSTELLAFHKSFHEIDKNLSLSSSDYYRPGNWVPHTTVALRCHPDDISDIVQRCLMHQTRIESQIGSIGLVETKTAEELTEVKF